jgi:ribosomal protein S6--L-glutamate ligase
LGHKTLVDKSKSPRLQIGWREWCALPKLHIPAIKVKIDTGAKTSALHAWDLATFHRQGELFVQFIVHPLQHDITLTRSCVARVIDQRTITSSSGQKELRYIIATPVLLGEMTWEIEISLTNRDSLSFRMLLGRDALKNHVIVDPGKTMQQGKLTKRSVRALYKTDK